MNFLESPQPSSPLRTAVRFWPVTAILIALGLVAGVKAAAKHAPTYTAEARLAVGGQDLSSLAIPGFAQASQVLAADYARYVSLPQQADALRKGLGAKATEVTSLSGSPVPSSNIISIEATSHQPDVATAAAKLAMNALMVAVNSPAKATVLPQLLTQYQAMSRQVAQADVDVQTAKQQLADLIAGKTATDADLAAARAGIVRASSELDSLTVQRSALANKYQQAATSTTPSSDLSIVQPATVIFDNKRSNEDKFALAGGAVGVVLALAITTLIGRLRPRRPRRPREPHELREPSQHRHEQKARVGPGEAQPTPADRSDEFASAATAERVGESGRA
ncbi:MAG: hypothetical protein QOC73_662 [Actinomycetota bacterium]|jgi:hypothetical protein|nr:hypothetical protein [Actinomycetota bacterium]